MKTFLRSIIIFSLSSTCLMAQDTFSIVVADTASKELGSAGASCIPNSIIISDIIQGIGVMHTQASYLPGNKNNARQYMEEGLDPDSVIKLLIKNDVQGRPEYRQYGIASLKGKSAAFTGDSCLNYHNHFFGNDGSVFFSIQGNILLGDYVIDSMKNAFLRTKGPLEVRMMAALQGANFPGADSRCLDSAKGYKKPSISAFIRLNKPNDWDRLGEYYMDINVGNTKPAQNPIDSLQFLFDNFVPVVPDGLSNFQSQIVHSVFPNPLGKENGINFRMYPIVDNNWDLEIFDLFGKLIFKKQFDATNSIFIESHLLTRGINIYKLKNKNSISTGRIVKN